jgi:hypothetical protein
VGETGAAFQGLAMTFEVHGLPAGRDFVLKGFSCSHVGPAAGAGAELRRPGPPGPAQTHAVRTPDQSGNRGRDREQRS